MSKVIPERPTSTRLLSFDAVGDRLMISRSRVYELATAGELPTVRVGRLRRVRETDLQRYVDGLTA